MTPLYRVDYKGFALIEGDTPEQALEILHQDGSDQCEEEITEISEIDLEGEVRLIQTVSDDSKKACAKRDNTNDDKIEKLIEAGFEVVDYAIDKIRAARAEVISDIKKLIDENGGGDPGIFGIRQ